MPQDQKGRTSLQAFRFIPIFRTWWCAKDAPSWFLQAECDGRARVWSDDEEPYCMVETWKGRERANAGDMIATFGGKLYVFKAPLRVRPGAELT